MLATDDIEQIRVANSSLSERVSSALEGYLWSLDFANPSAARDGLLDFVPTLTAQYGQVAASLAADWYEEQRAASGAVGRFAAALAPSVPNDTVQGTVRYLAGHLWTPTPESIISPLLLAADKYVKQPGRDTISHNARREGVRWARVPTGAKTCSFCLMVASRDAVYVSERAATRGRGGGAYHGHCDCQAVRISSKDDYPENYLPDNYYEMYKDARDEAASDDVGDIAAALRRIHPDAVNDGVHTH